MLAAADALRDHGAVLVNAGAIDDRLREGDCRANVIHVAPTRLDAGGQARPVSGMEAVEALALVVGSHARTDYADARGAATSFGAKIVQNERLREHRRRAAHRQRRDIDPASNAHAYPAGAGL